MIEKHEVMKLLLAACPSYQERFEPEYDENGESLLYLELGDFASYLVELYQRKDTAEFEKVFEVIESLHLAGDDYVKEAATIGLLEGIQNTALWEEVDPNDFVMYLKPESRKWWKYLEDFWEGK